MKSFSKVLPLSLLALSANALKVAIISDLHLQPYYNPNVDATTFCIQDSASNYSTTTERAPLGRIKCDPPAALIENFLKKIN